MVETGVINWEGYSKVQDLESRGRTLGWLLVVLDFIIAIHSRLKKIHRMGYNRYTLICIDTQY